MKVGRSFWSSFEDVLLKNDVFMQQKLRNLGSLLKSESLRKDVAVPKRMKKVIFELHRVISNPSNQLNKLESIRSNLESERNFRRKSGQITSHIRIQTTFLCGMYVAVVLFGGFSHGFDVVLGWLTYSVPIFLVGLILIYKLKRGFRWKV